MRRRQISLSLMLRGGDDNEDSDGLVPPIKLLSLEGRVQRLEKRGNWREIGHRFLWALTNSPILISLKKIL